MWLADVLSFAELLCFMVGVYFGLLVAFGFFSKLCCGADQRAGLVWQFLGVLHS